MLVSALDASVLFSAKTVGRRTIGVRIVGKILQVREIIVPDRERACFQISIFSSPLDTI